MDRSECFREFIFELSRRLADESDYEKELLPKFKELLNMTNWIVGEAWENGLGGEILSSGMAAITLISKIIISIDRRRRGAYSYIFYNIFWFCLLC